MFGLILLNHNVIPAHAQYDDFPIGMNLTYVVVVDIPPSLHTEVWNDYDFIQWEHQDNLTVEYEIDTISFVRPFHEIRLPGPDFPPLWMDVSTWSVGDRIEISGHEYPIIMMEDVFTGPPGLYECFRLEAVFVTEDRQNATSFWYHAELGLLLDYLRTDEELPSNDRIRSDSTFVVDGNFHYFDPPTFTVPQPSAMTTTTITTTIPPETTGTTTITTQPQQTTTTTSATVRGFEPPVGLTEIFVVGIAIELFVILIFIRTKMNS
jgi:hypothetical protein